MPCPVWMIVGNIHLPIRWSLCHWCVWIDNPHSRIQSYVDLGHRFVQQSIHHSRNQSKTFLQTSRMLKTKTFAHKVEKAGRLMIKAPRISTIKAKEVPIFVNRFNTSITFWSVKVKRPPLRPELSAPGVFVAESSWDLSSNMCSDTHCLQYWWKRASPR